MLNEQQEEKVQELANAFKKLADISNDDYFFKLIFFPDCFGRALEFEENKDKLFEELSASWKNAVIAPDNLSRDHNYIVSFWRKVKFLKT